jgi:hypothetical protein
MLYSFLVFCSVVANSILIANGWIPTTSLRRAYSKRALLPLSAQIADSNDPYPVPWVWKWQEETSVWARTALLNTQVVAEPEDDDKTDPTNTAAASTAALETWNWCRHFVLPLQLCPWAKASLETSRAIQVFVVENDSTTMMNEKKKRLMVSDLAEHFSSLLLVQQQQQQQQENNIASLESAAIFFLVFLDEDSKTFVDFYESFLDLEDTWENEEVIIAPFHPDWEFEGDDPSLSFEKKAPHPTISLVSAKVVNQAGPAATESIGRRNEETLLGKSPKQLRALWKSSIETLGSFE